MSRPTHIPAFSLSVRGYHPLWLSFPERFQLKNARHWPGLRSLATTNKVSVDVLSSGYLDVSVLQVRLLCLCIQHSMTPKGAGFSHSEICGSKFVDNSPQLIAAYHVLHRLYAPRHSPNALLRLIALIINTHANAWASIHIVRSGQTAFKSSLNQKYHLSSYTYDLQCQDASTGETIKAEAQRPQATKTSLTLSLRNIAEDILCPLKKCLLQNIYLFKYFLTYFFEYFLTYILSGPSTMHGGAERVRTDDLLLAKQALSQLSYGPCAMIFETFPDSATTLYQYHDSHSKT